MTSSRNQAASTDLARQMQELLNPNAVAVPGLERFREVQDDMLTEAESFAHRWFERRREATRTAAETVRAVNATGTTDPAEAMRAITGWQRGSLDRLNADLQAWIALCVRCADSASTAQRETAAVGMDRGAAEEGDRKADGKAASRPRSAHATPV